MAGSTKAQRAARIERAKALLVEAGWSVGESASNRVADKLIHEFGLADRRTARRLEARAARLLRGEAVDEMIGRPRTAETLRTGETVELVETVGGEVISTAQYTVEIADGLTWLKAMSGNDLILQRKSDD